MTEQEIELLKAENTWLKSVIEPFYVPEGAQEATAYPVWFIIEPGCICKDRQDDLHAVAHKFSGPFPSRMQAEQYLYSKRYNFSDTAGVYCHSAWQSRDYKALLDAALKLHGEKPRIPQLTGTEFLAQFEPEVHPQLLASLRTWLTATHMVRFSNRELLCGVYGLHKAFALCCGPDNTLKSLEELHANNYRTPVTPPFDHRAFLYYADNYASRDELLAELERTCG